MVLYDTNQYNMELLEVETIIKHNLWAHKLLLNKDIDLIEYWFIRIPNTVFTCILK